MASAFMHNFIPALKPLLSMSSTRSFSATAVADGYLVPTHVEQIDLKFLREGIDYDTLSDEEQWESLDLGEEVDERGMARPREHYQSHTWDRGSEMSDHKHFTLERGIKMYFCDLHHP